MKARTFLRILQALLLLSLVGQGCTDADADGDGAPAGSDPAENPDAGVIPAGAGGFTPAGADGAIPAGADGAMPAGADGGAAVDVDGGISLDAYVRTYANADEFLSAYADTLETSQDMTLDELIAAYPQPDYLDSPSYDPGAANHYARIKSVYGLTPEHEALLAANGFAVTDSPRFSSFGEAYLDVFYNDLPVFISTDSILQALHRSFDTILKTTEEIYLIDQLDQLLSKSHAQLETIADGFDTDIPDHLYDSDVLYTVARSLLSGGTVNSVLGDRSREEADELLGFIAEEGMRDIDIFGRERTYDFSQFKPRGHYTESEQLQRYFKAMIWLGRTDLRIQEYDGGTGEMELNERQLLVAHTLLTTVTESGAKTHWDEITRLVTLMIGDADDLDLDSFANFLQEVGVESGDDLRDPDKQLDLMARLDAEPLGVQKICSQIIYSDPFNPTVTPLPRSFLLMGQRFTVDSHVFSNVVFDRIVVDGMKVERMLPSPLDAWFALGNNRALEHLQPELVRYEYSGNLSVMRFLVDTYDRAFWEKNMYNGWLSGLRALSGPFVADPYPAPMKTGAYHDKLLHTQLASWSQLRHDTILYVKQSYTAFPVCEYPDGYVEPIPQFYSALSRYADKARLVFDASGIDAQQKEYITGHFARFKDTADTLRAIAQKQLDGLPYSEEETSFIKNTILEKPLDVICATVISYAGWYPMLFYQGVDDAVLRDPVVADVHTNPRDLQVLHAGTGDVNLMVLTVDTCNGPTAYAGPVFSYFERVEGGLSRLDDDEWEALLDAGQLAPPVWTSSFVSRP